MVSVKLAPLAVCLVVVLVCGVAGVDARSKKKSKSNADAASGTAHTYLLEHALNLAEPNVWTKRGSMTTNVQKLSRKVTIAFADSPMLTGRELAQFNALAEIGALYRVRTRKDANSPYIMASTKPCLLQAVGFLEFFQLHLDSAGSLVSFEYLFSEGSRCSNETQVTDDAAEFISKATVTGPTRVPTVHPNAVGGAPFPGQKKGATAGGVAQPGADGTTQGADGEEAAKPEAAASWTRYMYYALPVVLLVMLQGGPKPPAAGNGGGARK